MFKHHHLKCLLPARKYEKFDEFTLQQIEKLNADENQQIGDKK